MIEAYLKRSKHRREIMMAIPVLGGAFLGHILIFQPAIKDLKRVKSDLSSLSAKEAPYRFVADSEKIMEEIKTKLGPELDKTALIQKLNELAPQMRFSITSIMPEEPAPEGEYLKRLSVRLETEGTFHQMGEFIARLESLDTFARVTEVDFSTIRSDGQGGMAGPQIQQAANRRRGIFPATIVVSVFTINEPAKPVAKAAPKPGTKK